MKTQTLTDSDALRVLRLGPSGGDLAPGVAERHEASADCNVFAAPTDPIGAALQAVLELHRIGSGARELRRALRRVEELLDE